MKISRWASTAKTVVSIGLDGHCTACQAELMRKQAFKIRRLKFLEENDRPSWQDVASEHAPFLETLSD